jgi:hypothetical protein
MTWASQAYNPGSNPGDRIFYMSSNTDVEKSKSKKTDTMGIIFRKEEGEQTLDSVSLLTYLNANNTSHIHN